MELITEEFMIPGSDPSIQLYVRNKRPEGLTRFTPDNIVLFVHGATYPADTSFDLELDGLSWMDYVASRGYDAYLVNVRGFGRSTRPPEMDQPAANNWPLVRTTTAAKDVGAAVEFIRKRRGVDKINLLGWSWGAKQNPKVVRAPNGSVQDTRDFFGAGTPQYDPAAIRVPTLLIVAEWDADTPPYMAQALFPLLVNAPYKRLVMIGEGTHSIIMEKNRMQLFREVQLFLDEPAPGKPGIC